jgi:hypothetical protein
MKALAGDPEVLSARRTRQKNGAGQNFKTSLEVLCRSQTLPFHVFEPVDDK